VLTKYGKGTFFALSRGVTAPGMVSHIHDDTTGGYGSEYGQRRTKQATDGISYPLSLELSVNNSQPQSKVSGYSYLGRLVGHLLAATLAKQ
jgi:hypothetical protein